jgi:hypothetical protein
MYVNSQRIESCRRSITDPTFFISVILNHQTGDARGSGDDMQMQHQLSTFATF